MTIPPAVGHLLSAAGVEMAVLFGSAATGKLRADSDVDIGILPPFGRDIGVAKEFALGADLERVLGREVDLVRLDTASTLQRFEVSRGRCLFESRPGAFADFVARALFEHEDLRPFARRCAAGMFRRLAARTQGA